MIRSIFDSTSGGAERSGTRFTPADAGQISQLTERFSDTSPSTPGGTVDFKPPPENPSIEVTPENGDKLISVRLSGKLHSSDYAQFVPIVEAAVKKYGKVRMLVQMHDFHGWDAGGWWQDVKFDLRHFNDIERLAIIGEATWERWMAAFCKPFTTAAIRYFALEQAAEAREWVTAAE